MYALKNEEESPPVNDDSGRGAAIQQRIEQLGISDREFHEKTGIDRKTLRRAVAGVETTRPSTYAAIESALDALERDVKGVPPQQPIGDPGDDLIEFTIEGNFGVRAVVKGPVRDMAALQAAVAQLVRDMSGSPAANDLDNP